MVDKIGSVKNPLTIIAIFAGIAEVSGTTVLPFIEKSNQETFIWFLIVFPCALIVLFFATLNFNNKALYAPSDFSNEDNYIKIFRYDNSKQQSVEMTLSQDDLLKNINQELIDFKELSDKRFFTIEHQINATLKDENKAQVNLLLSKNAFVLISKFRSAEKFASIIRKLGYPAEVYGKEYREEGYSALSPHKSVWLGSRVNLDTAKEILKEAKQFYPHLQYIQLSDEDSGAPDDVHDTIFIGGSTQTALERHLKPISTLDFDKIQSFTSIDELHAFVRSLSET